MNLAELTTLRAFLAVAGCEFKKITRLRSGWALIAGILILSAAILLGPNHPFHQQGVTSLQSFCGLAQLLATFLVGASILVSRPPLRNAWWPHSPLGATVASVVGAWAATSLLLSVTIGAQFLGAWLSHDVALDDPLAWGAEPIGPPYLQLWLLALAFALVLQAWAQLLASTLHKAVALMTLFALMLCGFLLGQLLGISDALGVLLVFVPDLGALAPVQVTSGLVENPWERLAYAGAHAASICLAATVVVELQLRRGRTQAAAS
jgi:hypothetical protein